MDSIILAVMSNFFQWNCLLIASLYFQQANSKGKIMRKSSYQLQKPYRFYSSRYITDLYMLFRVGYLSTSFNTYAPL